MNYGYYGQQGYYNGYYPNQQVQQSQQVQQVQQGQQMVQQNPQLQQPNIQSIVYVASIEEVKAHPVDWSGGVTYYVDKVNSCIYTKQLGDNGIPVILTYKLDSNTQGNSEYVTRGEFEKVKTILENLLSQLGGVANEQQSNADVNANATK